MLSWKLTIKRRANYEQHTKPLWANATGTSVVTIGSRPVVRRFWLVGSARVRVANFWSSVEIDKDIVGIEFPVNEADGMETTKGRRQADPESQSQL
jgi:hypothetical protein